MDDRRTGVPRRAADARLERRVGRVDLAGRVALAAILTTLLLSAIYSGDASPVGVALRNNSGSAVAMIGMSACLLGLLIDFAVNDNPFVHAVFKPLARCRHYVYFFAGYFPLIPLFAASEIGIVRQASTFLIVFLFVFSNWLGVRSVRAKNRR